MMNNKRRKILFINGHLNVGGVEKSLVDLLNWIDYSCYDIDLLLLEDKGDYLSQLPSAVNVIYRSTKSVYGPFWWLLQKNLSAKNYADILFRIIMILSEVLSKKCLRFLFPLLHISNNYDVAIAYRPGICVDMLIYAVKSKRKIAWWHHGECDYSPLMIEVTNSTWKHLDYIVTVSNGCKKMLGSIFSFPVEKIVVIPNLIDIDKIEMKGGNCSPYIDEDAIQIVTVGRLSAEKHIEDVIYAMKKLISDNVLNLKWYIIGDGELYNDIKNKIHDLGLENYIFMLGKKTNPYPYIKYADILVHPSYVESQSITVLEAMALRTPCIVCRSLGPEEFIKSGINGILTEKSIDSLVLGIKTVIKSLDHSETMINEALVTVKEQYAPLVIVEKLNNLLYD
ncbi:glycosyltransferase [Bacteroides finegoldii]|jgi:glycosyltransferase involved in cell wall biosynthesis|uniref:glycosyltransferase n=1 Tax=Bacteroides finegoldii TaxID=338188 RepID=UPI0022E6C59E|nr:glycosyltransferase [Bacteroides finegoldii]